MKIVNMHAAKTSLSRLVDEATRGEPFVIAKAGRPLVKVTAIDAPLARPPKRIGFMPDIEVPDDFDTMAADEILGMFEGST